MSESDSPVRVEVTSGPYLVTGDVTLEYQVIAQDAEGASWTWKRGEQVRATSPVFLCRCGHSRNKPFCDDSHLTAGVDGTETASRAPHRDQAAMIEGPTMSMADVRPLCVLARFCDGHGDAWAAVEGSDDPASRAIAAHEASHCPAGRLVAYDKTAGGTALEPELEQAIGIIEDPAAGVSGGLWLRGGIPVTSADGTPYPVRNRMVLCRCGSSRNKPFCDGSHKRAKFSDDQLASYDATADGTDSVTTPGI